MDFGRARRELAFSGLGYHGHRQAMGVGFGEGDKDTLRRPGKIASQIQVCLGEEAPNFYKRTVKFLFFGFFCFNFNSSSSMPYRSHFFKQFLRTYKFNLKSLQW